MAAVWPSPHKDGGRHTGIGNSNNKPLAWHTVRESCQTGEEACEKADYVDFADQDSSASRMLLLKFGDLLHIASSARVLFLCVFYF